MQFKTAVHSMMGEYGWEEDEHSLSDGVISDKTN